MTTAGVTAVAATDIHVCDLSDDPANPGTWAHEPASTDTFVAIDPTHGRVAYPDAPASGTTRVATFHRGSALLHRGWRLRPFEPIEPVDEVVLASEVESLGPLLDSVADGGAVQIVDCRQLRRPRPRSRSSARPPRRTTARPPCARSNRMRPLLSRTSGQIRLDIEPNATMVLDGLLIAGAPVVIDEAADAAPAPPGDTALHVGSRA